MSRAPAARPRPELPAASPVRLDPEDGCWPRRGTDAGPLLVTSLGLWLPEPDGTARRVGWHLISKASWQAGMLR